MHSDCAQAKENSITALTQLAYKSRTNQDACADAGGIPLIVNLLAAATNNAKEASAQVGMAHTLMTS